MIMCGKMSILLFDIVLILRMLNYEILHLTQEKECLEGYGFHDVWLTGRVADKSAFLSSFKNRMVGRFRGDWYSKISTSDRFSTYKVFKLTHQKEKYLDSITIKKV